MHNDNDNDANNTGGTVHSNGYLNHVTRYIDFTYNALSVMIHRSNESLENSRRVDRLHVDNRDEYEHRIFASNIGTASEAIQPKPSRTGINVCH